MNIFSCDSNLTSTNVCLSVSPSVTKQCIEIAYKQQSPVIHESHPWQSSKTAIQDSLIHDSHPSPHQSHFQLSNTAISIQTSIKTTKIQYSWHIFDEYCVITSYRQIIFGSKPWALRYASLEDDNRMFLHNLVSWYVYCLSLFSCLSSRVSFPLTCFFWGVWVFGDCFLFWVKIFELLDFFLNLFFSVFWFFPSINWNESISPLILNKIILNQVATHFSFESIRKFSFTDFRISSLSESKLPLILLIIPEITCKF